MEPLGQGHGACRLRSIRPVRFPIRFQPRDIHAGQPELLCCYWTSSLPVLCPLFRQTRCANPLVSGPMPQGDRMCRVVYFWTMLRFSLKLTCRILSRIRPGTKYIAQTTRFDDVHWSTRLSLVEYQRRLILHKLMYPA